VDELAIKSERAVKIDIYITGTLVSKYAIYVTDLMCR